MAYIHRPCPECGEDFITRTDRPDACCSHRCAAIRFRRNRAVPLADRFWAKVDRREGPQDHWPWTGALHPSGYGQIGVDGRATHAHRVAWELVAGPIPAGLWVLHVCDTPTCCRNDDEGVYEVNGVMLPRRGHLFLGTRADNIADMVAKGRQGTGNRPDRRPPAARLTETQLAEIKARLATGARGIGRALAREYGVSEATISLIRSGKTWR